MANGGDLLDFLARGEAVPQRPWPRFRLARTQWLDLLTHLAVADWTLLALWAEPDEVHAAFCDAEGDAVATASLACPEGSFPSLAALRPGALRLERAVQDLAGLVSEGIGDARPWLDHGRWHRPDATARPATPYAFLAAEGDGLHQVAVGPIHAGTIEPGHFRFHCSGEAVVRLEPRLGYAHKGTERLMEGQAPAQAARLAGRLSGDSTVAMALAFARAVETAGGTAVPERAIWLRALLAELERLANHLGDIGGIANDASFAFLQSHLMVLREHVLRAADETFGHRLMMDVVVPGGLARDLDGAGAARLRALAATIGPRFAELMAIYDGKPSLLDRTIGAGVVTPELARRFAAGGFVGRASGRRFDARKQPGYPPYDRLDFAVPVLADGDVHSRLLIRAAEVEASLGLVEQILDRLPEGPVLAPLAGGTGDGMALVEGFRGDILAWVALGLDGSVRRAHLRDPSWFQWPLLEAAIEGNIIADFPLCNKSFNCAYSGHDR